MNNRGFNSPECRPHPKVSMSSGDHGVSGAEKYHLFMFGFCQDIFGVDFNILTAQQVHRLSIMSLEFLMRCTHEPGRVRFKKYMVCTTDCSEPFFRNIYLIVE